jgi:hypothetical protein
MGMLADICLQPINDLRSYTPRKFRADLLAGLTVAVVGIPQAMAFALIAGVPPIYGIYGLIDGPTAHRVAVHIRASPVHWADQHAQPPHRGDRHEAQPPRPPALNTLNW